MVRSEGGRICWNVKRLQRFAKTKVHFRLISAFCDSASLCTNLGLPRNYGQKLRSIDAVTALREHLHYAAAGQAWPA